MWNRREFAELVRPGAVGMIHLEALPGSPAWKGAMAPVIEAALADCQALVAGGLNALMVENYGDIPFFPGRVPAVTVAAMTRVVAAIGAEFPAIRLGVNVLRNDVDSALGIAAATGAHFVRVNVHTGAAVTDQGTLEGRAFATLRRRRELGAEVGIMADVRVKHARPLVERPLAEEARDLRLRGLADAVIITGAATGAGAAPADLAVVREALPDCPLLIGSGVTAATVGKFLPQADGVIIGSALKAKGAPGSRFAVSTAKTREFVQALAQVVAEGSQS